MARFDLTDFEWSVIQPLLPTKVRGVPRVDDRRVLNGIFWRLRTGAPWADIPRRYGPHTTCVNRFNRWRKAGAWAGHFPEFRELPTDKARDEECPASGSPTGPIYGRGESEAECLLGRTSGIPWTQISGQSPEAVFRGAETGSS